jgi:hypothetical protein
MIPHWVTDLSAILIPIIIPGAAWVFRMSMKNSIQESTNKITDRIVDLGTSLTAHVASDEQKHKAIDEHLQATDTRVGRIENKVWT